VFPRNNEASRGEALGEKSYHNIHLIHTTLANRGRHEL
jgi:hypothetical protein